MTKVHIGCVGAGLAGHGMAQNLVKKGYPQTIAAHRNRARLDA